MFAFSFISLQKQWFIYKLDSVGLFPTCMIIDWVYFMTHCTLDVVMLPDQPLIKKLQKF